MYDQIEFMTGGAVDTPPIPWQDRPTFQQAVRDPAAEGPFRSASFVTEVERLGLRVEHAQALARADDVEQARDCAFGQQHDREPASADAQLPARPDQGAQAGGVAEIDAREVDHDALHPVPARRVERGAQPRRGGEVELAEHLEQPDSLDVRLVYGESASPIMGSPS